MQTMTKLEKLGMEAIIFLQDLADIKEDAATALAGWRKMTVRQKSQTITAYRTLKAVAVNTREAACKS